MNVCNQNNSKTTGGRFTINFIVTLFCSLDEYYLTKIISFGLIFGQFPDVTARDCYGKYRGRGKILSWEEDEKDFPSRGFDRRRYLKQLSTNTKDLDSIEPR